MNKKLKKIYWFLGVTGVLFGFNGQCFAQDVIGHRSITFEALSENFEQDNVNLSKIFDANYSLLSSDTVLVDFPYLESSSESISKKVVNYNIKNIKDGELFVSQVPKLGNNFEVMQNIGTKYPSQFETLSDYDKKRINKALSLLFTTEIGKSLAQFQKNEGIEVLWADLSSFSGADAIAEVPYNGTHNSKVPNNGYYYGKKVIYLNKNKKDLLLRGSKTSAYLATVLAHELTHQIDLKNIGKIEPRNGTIGLFLELRGLSSAVYVYHELLAKKSYMVPRANSSEEHGGFRNLRFCIALRSYLSQNNYISERDFYNIDYSDYGTFNKYVRGIGGGRRGIMSLAGVVKDKYFELESAPENPENLNNKQYEQYKKLWNALDKSTSQYLRWYNNNYSSANSVWREDFLSDNNGNNANSDNHDGHDDIPGDNNGVGEYFKR